MKTELQKFLVQFAPSVKIETIWEHDPNAGTLSEKDEGADSSDDDNWQAWQSEVRATIIFAGEELKGSDYLGGTFEKADDHPSESNPNISGYESGMTQAALTELLKLVDAQEDPFRWNQLTTLKKELVEALEQLEARDRLESRKARDWEATR